MIKKKNTIESGNSHEFVIIGIIIVGLLGVLGFLGYNAWNQKNTQAGGIQTIGKPTVIRVATYNVLSQQWDGQTRQDTWSKRLPRVSSQITKANPGIVGMQEVTYKYPTRSGYSTQRSSIANSMETKGYAGYAGSADNSDPIFYKKSAFSSVGRGEAKIVSAVSDPKAKGPAARYLTWLRLKKDGKSILVFNYHFNQFREKQAQIKKLKDKINSIKKRGDYIIFTGDFNGRDYDIRNTTGLWRADDATSVDHILVSSNIAREGNPGWKDYGKGSPAASDHSLVLVRAKLK